MKTEAPERQTLTVPEVAAMLGVSRILAYRAVQRGEIPSFRIGTKILVPRAKVEAMIEGAGS